MSQTGEPQTEWGWWSRGEYRFALQRRPDGRWVFPTLIGVILRSQEELERYYHYDGAANPVLGEVPAVVGEETRKLRL